MRLVIIILSILGMTLSGTFGAYLFKTTIPKIKTRSIFGILFVPSLYLGGGIYVFGALLNIYLLSELDYTIVYPMTSLTYVWTMLFSKIVLQEKIDKYKVAAMCLIIVGIILIVL